MVCIGRRANVREMSDSVTLLVGVLTAITLCLGLLGLAVRFILLPYVREHLVEPVRSVEKQVTENHHANPHPTLPDRLSELSTQNMDLSLQISALAHMFDGHLDWSQEEVRNIWRAIDRLGINVTKPLPKTRGSEPDSD